MSGEEERRIGARVRENVGRCLEERAPQSEREMLETFNRAAAELTDEDYAERERLIGAFAHYHERQADERRVIRRGVGSVPDSLSPGTVE